MLHQPTYFEINKIWFSKCICVPYYWNLTLSFCLFETLDRLLVLRECNLTFLTGNREITALHDRISAPILSLLPQHWTPVLHFSIFLDFYSLFLFTWNVVVLEFTWKQFHPLKPCIYLNIPHKVLYFFARKVRWTYSVPHIQVRHLFFFIRTWIISSLCSCLIL